MEPIRRARSRAHQGTDSARDPSDFLGMRVGSKFRAQRGGAILTRIPMLFRRMTIAVGYDDERKAIRIQNSHGKAWGRTVAMPGLSYEFWKRSVQLGHRRCLAR